MTRMPSLEMLTRARLTRWAVGLLLGVSYAVAAQLTIKSEDLAFSLHRIVVGPKMPDHNFAIQTPPVPVPPAKEKAENPPIVLLLGTNSRSATVTDSLRLQAIQRKACSTFVVTLGDSANLARVAQVL
mgnify:CR=1 FL=1